jgi:hypothetical protein
MKSLLNVILLSPILVYVILMFINLGLLSQKAEVNLFWLWSGEISIITIISFFFVSYIMIMYSLFKFSNFFAHNKNKNLTEEINTIKAKMQDREPKLLEKIEKKFEKILAKSQEQNHTNIKVLKKENEKVITNLTYELQSIKDTLNKNTK